MKTDSRACADRYYLPAIGGEALVGSGLSATDRRGEWLCLLAGIVVVGFIGLTDFLTGGEISFSIFYLIPIAFATWCAGSRVGGAVAGVSGCVWLASDLMAGTAYSHPLIPYWNAFVRLCIFVGMSVMISMLRAAEARAREMAGTDALTEAKNARYLREMAEYEIEKMRRHGRPLSVAYFDMDNFKAVNDTLGHSTGDSLLRLAAYCFREEFRHTDIVARVGGDEFVVVMPETDQAAALETVDRVRGAFTDAMARNQWNVSLSTGLVTFAAPPCSINYLLQAADGLMYEAKKAGKDTVRTKMA